MPEAVEAAILESPFAWRGGEAIGQGFDRVADQDRPDCVCLQLATTRPAKDTAVLPSVQSVQDSAQIGGHRTPPVLAVLGTSLLPNSSLRRAGVIGDVYDVAIEVDVCPPERSGLTDP
jgi:hypothetical protein